MGPGWFSYKGLILDLHGADGVGVEILEVPGNVYQRLLGGRSLAVYLWLSLAASLSEPPKPLAPENPLVIAPGALVGSGLSTASKTAFVARSPLTGLLGRSMAGGRLGLEVRRLGYDFLVIRGALEEPGVLVLDETGARVEQARGLWGKTVGEARAALSRDFKGYADAIIGPAGENLSAISMIDVGGRQAGRTGLGAVMGAKRLKAILVRGYRDPRPLDPPEARRLAVALNRITSENQASKALVEYGTPIILDYTNKKYGVFPGLNWKRSDLSWCRDSERAHRELSRFAPEKRVSRNPCVGCARPCSQVLEARGARVDGPEYETVYALGSDLGICRIDDIAYLNSLADELGFDTISLGATIAWAIHAGEEGLLEGAPSWGDVESIAGLIRDMAYRRGRLGSLLADGSRRAAERLGAGAELSINVKGMELPAYDARGLKGMALGFAVSSRGGDHLTSGAYAIELPGKLWVYEGVDRLAVRGKGVLVKQAEDLMGFYDATGICKFSRYTLNPENVSPLVEAVTGLKETPGDLLRAGERAVNLERIANIWMGLDPARDDTLPVRLMVEPISSGPSRGSLVRPEELNVMKSEYYAARGWSSSGVPLISTMIYLDMLDLVPEKLRPLLARSP
ncbi:MAG: aldehyde ferredoxin oxidoreductase family protein [Desulfurococcales archaeon]|nr:aldehyde ferredoxin oxidoreductase family protein [Desulfurococcales archaeon]